MTICFIHAWLAWRMARGTPASAVVRQAFCCDTAGVIAACNFGVLLFLQQDRLTRSQYDSKRITRLSERLKDGLLSMEHTSLNGDPTRHYPGCVNVSFAYVEGESLLMALKDIALSSGSACTSASLEPSYVLRALGNSDESAHSSIRFGIGRFTSEAEIDYVLKAVRERVTFLRELSPLWELVQEGVDLNTIEWSQH